MIRKTILDYLHKNNQTAFNLKAVLFDMDGVLFDTMPSHTRAWYETATRHHLISTPEDFFLLEGRTGDSTVNILFQRTFQRDATEEEKKEIYKEKAALFNHYNEGKIMKGAPEVLEQVKACGLQTLVVTGSGQYSLFDRLNEAFPGVFDRDKMVTAYDVKYGKPNPEPYLMGLAKAGVRPTEAIVIENAPLGVESAVAAGIFTIAVNTGPLASHTLTDAGASLLYHDMTSLAEDWENIMECIKFPHF